MMVVSSLFLDISVAVLYLSCFSSNSVCVNGAALGLLSLLQRESLVFNVVLDSLLE